MTEAEAKKIDAEIANLMANTARASADVALAAAQTRKLNKEIRWYEAVIIAGGASALTLAIVAVTKLFL